MLIEISKHTKLTDRSIVYDIKKEPDWLVRASFHPEFTIVKVVGGIRKRVAIGSASDKPVG